MKAAVTASKIRVGVLFGGKSIEREVSLNSGRTICDHLDTNKYNVVPIFQDGDGTIYILPWKFLHRGKISDFQHRLSAEAKKISWDDLKGLVDFVYLAVHGRFAEDGTIQGMLEILGIPYLGSKILGSAVGMNKLVQKEIFKANKIDVARGIAIHESEIKSITAEDVLYRLEKEGVKLPVIVKPVHEGSSLGITKVSTESDLLPAIFKASSIDSRRVQAVIVEEVIDGMEFVCVSLQKVTTVDDKIKAEWFTLPITEVIPENAGIFDYEQKYMPGRASKITPARCSAQDLDRIAQTCVKASELLNFTTISRIDGFLATDGRIILIDPNTLTGMSPSTFLFHQAAEFGMSHTQLINYLIESELKLAGMLDFNQGNNQGDVWVTSENGAKRIRVAVLLGGNTNEREISLESGRNVCYKLSPQKYECLPVFVDDKMELYKLSNRLLIKNSTREISKALDQAEKISWSNLSEICDFVFIGLHGGLGEGGGVQGALEMLEIPYNGSGVLASALCMDKFKTNNLLRQCGFDVPESSVIDICDWVGKSDDFKNESLNSVLSGLAFPIILKPHDDGCSVFVQKVESLGDLIVKVDKYFDETSKSKVMLEEMIVGTELTCGVIGNNDVMALAPSMAVAKGGVLSIAEKFLPGEGENQTPAPLASETLELVRKTMESAYKTIGCRGYARIDCFYQDEKQSPSGKARVVILEFNTLPGMTPATCIFHQAAEYGMRPMDFIDKIIDLGFENHADKLKFKKSQLPVKNECKDNPVNNEVEVDQDKVSRKKSKQAGKVGLELEGRVEGSTNESKTSENDGFIMKLF